MIHRFFVNSHVLLTFVGLKIILDFFLYVYECTYSFFFLSSLTRQWLNKMRGNNREFTVTRSREYLLEQPSPMILRKGKQQGKASSIRDEKRLVPCDQWMCLIHLAYTYAHTWINIERCIIRDTRVTTNMAIERRRNTRKKWETRASQCPHHSFFRKQRTIVVYKRSRTSSHDFYSLKKISRNQYSWTYNNHYPLMFCIKCVPKLTKSAHPQRFIVGLYTNFATIVKQPFQLIQLLFCTNNLKFW